MADRIYVGNGKEKTFPDGGTIVTITVDIDAIMTACRDYGFTTDAGKRKIKLKVGRRRDVDQYGNTHNVEVDTWKPEQGRQSTQSAHGGAVYQPRPKNASATPSRANREDSTPPDFHDNSDIPF